jgi:thiamine biosynthesis protein ThiS
MGNNTVKCTINGLEYSLPEGAMLVDFLKDKNVPENAAVIELNGTVLPRGQYDGIPLSDGDRVEIVQIIGGG